MPTASHKHRERHRRGPAPKHVSKWSNDEILDTILSNLQTMVDKLDRIIGTMDRIISRSDTFNDK